MSATSGKAGGLHYGGRLKAGELCQFGCHALCRCLSIHRPSRGLCVLSATSSNAHRHRRAVSQTINALSGCDFSATGLKNIPGTVKLWESPRQSRGVSHWTKFQYVKQAVASEVNQSQWLTQST